MRTIKTTLVLLLLGLFTGRPAANAQGFLKNIINSAKNSAQNRANNAASNATNKALDKVDPTTKGGNPSTPNSGNKSDNDRVLGGFAKAAQDNPNDSNLIAKALGNIMSGNGVSAEDSAKALAAFQNTGNSGNTPCIYYEITNTMIPDDKGRKTSSTTTKQWFTKDGRFRGEMDLAGMIASAAGYQINSKPIVMIGRVSMPNYTVTLDDENKTYALNIIDQALLDKNGAGYTAKFIGSETVNGYPCKHVVIKGHKMTLDMWTSTSVPGYDVYQKLASTASGANASFINALKQIDADGIMVKTIIENNASSMTLTKAVYIGAPNSLFEIPSGYTKSEYNGVITNLMKAGMGGRK